MIRFLVIALVLATGCSQPNPTDLEISVVETPPTDPDRQETQVRFRVPPESAIQVACGWGKETIYTDRLNSDGMFAAKLVVTRDKPGDDDGFRRFTAFINVGRPETKLGSHIIFTFAEDRSLEDLLEVTATNGSVPLGIPHRLGTLNGKPITLLVRPGVGLPRSGSDRLQ